MVGDRLVGRELEQFVTVPVPAVGLDRAVGIAGRAGVEGHRLAGSPWIGAEREVGGRRFVRRLDFHRGALDGVALPAGPVDGDDRRVISGFGVAVSDREVGRLGPLVLAVTVEIVAQIRRVLGLAGVDRHGLVDDDRGRFDRTPGDHVCLDDLDLAPLRTVDPIVVLDGERDVPEPSLEERVFDDRIGRRLLDPFVAVPVPVVGDDFAVGVD